MTLTTRYNFGPFLNSLGLTGKGVEVGSHQGRFAADIIHRWKGEKLYLVDAWRKIEFWKDHFGMVTQDHIANMAMAVRFLEPFRERVCVIRELSLEAAQLFQDKSLDFVYIDADHSYEAVKADIEAWLPKIRVGGIIAGHDYDNREGHGYKYGVKQAVDEIFGDKVNSTDEPDPTWWLLVS